MHPLFVYGTLKHGCKNHNRLAGQIRAGEARTAPGFRLYHLGDYPGMVVDPDDAEGVTGELWWVDEATLALLDDFEGVSEGLYSRNPIRLLPPFDTVAADTYLYARSTAGHRRLGATWTE